MKKLLFTREQLHKIFEHFNINEDDLYLDTTEDGNYPSDSDMPFNLGKITVANGTPEKNGSLTGDKLYNMRKTHPYTGFRYGIYEGRKKKVLKESNSDLDKSSIKFNDLQIQQLTNALNKNGNNKTVKGYDRIQNWLKAGSISYADAYRTLRDHNDKNYNNESILPHDFISFLKNKINNGKFVSKVCRDSKTDVNKLVGTNKSPNAMHGTGKGHHDGEKIGNSTIHYFK